MADFDRDDALRALTAMKDQEVAVLLEGSVSSASYLGACHGRLVGPDEATGDGRWFIDDGQEPRRYDGTWFKVPEDVVASLSEATLTLRHADGVITVTADRGLDEGLGGWKRSIE